MNYKTHDEKEIQTSGTFLQGIVEVDYEDIYPVFGHPMNMDGAFKVDWEWLIEFEDGTIATIYNWKDGPNYSAANWNVGPEDITRWHVGGFSQRALEHVKRLLALSSGKHV